MAVTIFCISSLNISYVQLSNLGVKKWLNNAKVTDFEIKTDLTNMYYEDLVRRLNLSTSLAIKPELIYTNQDTKNRKIVKILKNEHGYITTPVMFQVNISDILFLKHEAKASFFLSIKNNFNNNDFQKIHFTTNAGSRFKINENLFSQSRYG